jgi:mRNA interferase HigB
MRIHLVKRKTIEAYEEANAGSRGPFTVWLTELRKCDWNKPENIREIFSSADLLGNGTNRVVFDIGGNLYRMICEYLFGQEETHLYICWIGTHAEYTKLCKNKKQYTVSKY